MNEATPSSRTPAAAARPRPGGVCFLVDCAHGGVVLLIILVMWLLSHRGIRPAEPAPAPSAEDRALLTALAPAVEGCLQENGGRLPASVAAPPGADGDTDTDTAPGSGLVAALRGRLEVFPQARADADAPAGRENGLVPDAARPAIYDTRGRVIRARVDTNGDGQVANPRPDQAARGGGPLSQRVILWTAGKDGDWNTWADNVRTWE